VNERAAGDLSRDEMIKDMAKLLAGLQVPVSMGMPLGAAKDPWVRLHRGLHAFGWAGAEDYEAEIREVLAS
jgi:hypothetical protein